MAAGTDVVRWGLRLITAAALAVDAVVHNELVHRYAPNRSGGLSQGQLFRIEAVVALAAAVLLLITARWFAWAVAFAVAASALAAVLLSTEYHVGALGPIPDMYEPIWYGKKTLAAIAEAVGTLSAAAGLAIQFAGHRRRGARHHGAAPTHAEGFGEFSSQPATADPSESAATNFGAPFS
jgi:hypothetical protein